MSHNNPAQIDYYQQRHGAHKWKNKPTRKIAMRMRSKYPFPVPPGRQYIANARRIKAPLTYPEMP